MTLTDFLAEPTKEQWCRELAEHYWKGPNGSSVSLDAIMGVRIGRKSPAYEFHRLPANKHDWRYQLGRHHDLVPDWTIYADQHYRDGCLAMVRDALVGPWLWLAISFCHARYLGLRLHARVITFLGLSPWAD